MFSGLYITSPGNEIYTILSPCFNLHLEDEEQRLKVSLNIPQQGNSNQIHLQESVILAQSMALSLFGMSGASRLLLHGHFPEEHLRLKPHAEGNPRMDGSGNSGRVPSSMLLLIQQHTCSASSALFCGPTDLFIYFNDQHSFTLKGISSEQLCTFNRMRLEEKGRDWEPRSGSGQRA